MRAAKVAPGADVAAGECLHAQDGAVLAFAAEHHLQSRVRERVQQQLRMTETRYYHLLLALLDRADVADPEPELVAQLLGLRERRRRLIDDKPAPPSRTSGSERARRSSLVITRGVTG